MCDDTKLFKNELKALQALRNEALTFEDRLNALRGIERMLTEGEASLLDAVWRDLHKSATEAYITEIDQTLREARLFRRKLRHWAKPKRAGFSMMHAGSCGRVFAEPYGVVLIMSPWNYPIQLALAPTIAAIGAGNRVVLSMSPRAKATAAAIRALAAHYVSPAALRVVSPDAPDAHCVHTYRYDYVFYTGGPLFGRQVASCAAQTLTPCTLELGGKSPVIVFGEKNLEKAAKRIAWGKWLNAGQTCVAPDYVLAQRGIARKLADLLAKCATRSFGSNPADSPDFPRMVDQNAAERLAHMLNDVEIIAGGEYRCSDRYVAPTIVYNPPLSHPLMQQEIFGPVLPILPIDSVQEAIDFINQGDRPLALYFFGDSMGFKKVLCETRSGGICRGDTIMHITHPGLPFGGIGASGYGNYHGKAGFETFTHRKAVLNAASTPEIPQRYPPYKQLPFVKRLLRLVK